MTCAPHHWKIESPEEARRRGDNAFYIGRCRTCGAERRFRNDRDIDEYGTYRPMRRYARKPPV